MLLSDEDVGYGGLASHFAESRLIAEPSSMRMLAASLVAPSIVAESTYQLGPTQSRRTLRHCR